MKIVTSFIVLFYCFNESLSLFTPTYAGNMKRLMDEFGPLYRMNFQSREPHETREQPLSAETYLTTITAIPETTAKPSIITVVPYKEEPSLLATTISSSQESSDQTDSHQKDAAVRNIELNPTTVLSTISITSTITDNALSLATSTVSATDESSTSTLSPPLSTISTTNETIDHTFSSPLTTISTTNEITDQTLSSPTNITLATEETVDFAFIHSITVSNTEASKNHIYNRNAGVVLDSMDKCDCKCPDEGKIRENGMIVPERCANETFCDDILYYPEEKFERVLQHYPIDDILKGFFDTGGTGDIVQLNEGRPNEVSVCETVRKTLKPKAIKSLRDGKWKAVLNFKSYSQRFVVEKCVEFGPCSIVPSTIPSKCTQKFMAVEILALSEKNTPQVESFSVPSGCVCMYKMNN